MTYVVSNGTLLPRIGIKPTNNCSIPEFRFYNSLKICSDMKQGQKGHKNNYGSKYLELSNSARNACKNSQNFKKCSNWPLKALN